jgi:cytoskeletal protein CcmA (bactofilin family)
VRFLIYIKTNGSVIRLLTPLITLRLTIMFSIRKDSTSNSSPFSSGKAQTKSEDAASLSIISSDVTITGDIVSLGDVQIEGAINGNLRAQSVVVGGEANVHGQIAAEEVLVRGYIKGEIRGDRVTLSPGCLVIGNIFHKLLTIETGADFDGRCNRCEEPLEEAAINQKTAAEHHAGPATAIPTVDDPKSAGRNVGTKKATSTVGAFSPAAARAEIAALQARDATHGDEIDALEQEHHEAEEAEAAPQPKSGGQKTKRRVIGTHLAPRPAYAKSSTG